MKRASEKHNDFKEAVEYIKRHFEGEYGGNWSVIFGNSFASSVPDDFEECLHLKLGYVDVLIFPTG